MQLPGTSKNQLYWETALVKKASLWVRVKAHRSHSHTAQTAHDKDPSFSHPYVGIGSRDTLTPLTPCMTKRTWPKIAKKIAKM